MKTTGVAEDSVVAEESLEVVAVIFVDEEEATFLIEDAEIGVALEEEEISGAAAEVVIVATSTIAETVIAQEVEIRIKFESQLLEITNGPLTHQMKVPAVEDGELMLTRCNSLVIFGAQQRLPRTLRV